jgi:hypothetical protein
MPDGGHDAGFHQQIDGFRFHGSSLFL